MAIQKSLLWLSFLILNLSSFLVNGEGPECPENSFNRAGFPKGFMFGTASSAFQYEGAPSKGCKGPSIWDYYIKKYPERNAGQTDKDIEAVDFYHRYKEDIQLMKSLNMDAFRLSISWPRIFPHGRMIKGVSEEGLRFYDDLINELIANGIKPLVTLFHWDLPQDLEDEYGGFRSERIVDDFREYANFTFNRFGDRVKHWITFNEPYVFSRAGYDNGRKAPGRCSKYMNPQCQEGKSGYEAYIVSHNLLLAHADAVAEFRKCPVCKNGKIGISHAPAWFEPHEPEDPNSQKAIQRALDFILGWHTHPTKYGDYPTNMKDLLKERLPTFTDAQKAKLKNSYDFVGINYYSSAFIAHNDSHDTRTPNWMADSRVSWKPFNKLGQKIAPQASKGKLPVYPDGLRRLMNYIKDRYENPEIIITENGYGEEFNDNIPLEEGLKDYSRKTYHIRHLASLRRAICEDKVNVTGYFVWSLLDNIEWQEGRSARFGLYYIDFKNNLTRHAKESTKWFTEFLKRDPAKKDEL